MAANVGQYFPTLNKTARVWGYMFLFDCKKKKKTEDGLQVAAMNGQKKRMRAPPPLFLKMAEDHLMEETQKTLDIKKGWAISHSNIRTFSLFKNMQMCNHTFCRSIKM